MSWLSNFVKPKIQALVKKIEVPKDLWVKCSGCEQMVYNKDLVNELEKVCVDLVGCSAPEGYIDCVIVVNIQLGSLSRQTTSNLGHLQKPSLTAIIHGLNRQKSKPTF